MTETTNLHLKKPENSDFVNVADLNYNSDILDETIHQIQEDIKGDIDTSAYATAISMTLNSDTYVISAFLINKDGETLGTPQTIDLPLETMVVNGTYDNTTKKVILTLKNGNTVEFSVADLVSGLQSEITSSNKLDSDLISDTNQNNKFVTSAEKTTWTAKQSALTSAQLTAVNSGIDSSKVSQIEKNNSALIGLIDSGQKNLVDAQNPSGQQRVTIVSGTNGSAVISCSNATWATTAYHVYVTPNEDYKLLLYADEADVSNVTFRCFTSAVDDDGAELEVLPRTERITETGVYTLDINTQYNRIKISPNINNSATAGSGSATIRMMLCSKAAWDISQKYVPYRPSYDELVARITALENA